MVAVFGKVVRVDGSLQQTDVGAGPAFKRLEQDEQEEQACRKVLGRKESGFWRNGQKPIPRKHGECGLSGTNGN